MCMDILSFVNSRDIRKYLRDIDYKCDPMQAAWLVYQNYDKPYGKKHKAWQWIIDNIQDCEIPEILKVQTEPAWLSEGTDAVPG